MIALAELVEPFQHQVRLEVVDRARMFDDGRACPSRCDHNGVWDVAAPEGRDQTVTERDATIEDP